MLVEDLIKALQAEDPKAKVAIQSTNEYAPVIPTEVKVVDLGGEKTVLVTIDFEW